ncbi:dihydrofolate reductase [Frankia sp. CcI156]|uniref:metal-dependent transcriptional regulator n=1 Tax=Frankia TaxID=1854 RepID=UPI000309E183|nr:MULTISPECIES: metal-dependent transcriptional regulator [Frankia]ETA04484.1 iron (metal) dependent repressor, DtxR family [Frankia sp. CcI6]EYT92263.1 iron (metal) dependent repressor, DtxR family [Frankia casuarinae]KDA42474.1 iron (metal) dependent repressor, DtxR family [Frankia sp. BMG5.23]KEZ38018.1 iron (metal) dependent repressor, DtxR family [Frankia sp. CeD]KFB06470.1 iron (metal) dependent repressor, DtxR family [Frankia sp. Allo2]
MTGLIDSTEMYLRTLYELREEGIPPLRARLVERLHVSAPAASESTARLANEGLVCLADDRTVQFTEKGLLRATAVMRKHRLAELLLTKVIGLDWALVHNEACRWEHVISDEVEARLTVLLGDPKRCPFGNEIPPSQQHHTTARPASAPVSLLASADLASSGGGRPVTVSWISERLQTDESIMRRLQDAAIVPGAQITPGSRGNLIHIVTPNGQTDAEISRSTAALVYVDR